MEVIKNMKTVKNNSIILIVFLISAITFAQKKEKDTLGTEVINVVKPYTPTVSDAFKIKSSPEINDASLNKKNPIEYTIFSVPVVSTFTPDKGKAKVLRIKRSEPVYENYISAGFGTFRSPQIDIFYHNNTTRDNDFGGFINFHSSRGGLKNVSLNNDFYDGKFDGFYKQDNQYYSWKINGGARLQKYNWYGLPENINFRGDANSSIQEAHKYTNIYAGGELDYFDSVFQGGDAILNLFTDNKGSQELHLLVQPKLDLPIASEYITANARLEFLQTSFAQNYAFTGKLNHTFFTAGINPNLEVLRDNLTLNLGADFLFSATSVSGEDSRVYIYPKVTASYILIDQILTVYTGAIGGLHQNSYKEFVDKNPFVSPTLNIKRTDEQYNAFIGFKGKLASNIGYNFKGFYKSEKNKPMYKLNPTKTDGVLLVERGYEAGNSFQIVYDNVKTIGGIAEIDINLSKEFKFGGNLAYNIYTLTNEAKAWNLPTLKAGGFAKYNNDKWFAGADLFFSGDRKDEFTSTINAAKSLLKLGNYIDLNLNGGYKFGGKLTAFAKVNNVFNSNYQKYANFKVQGLQLVGGITFKFD